jgi:hypothetical protein
LKTATGRFSPAIDDSASIPESGIADSDHST